ncbi:MAG: hypothetical protein J7K21_06295 [Desulfurococcales archaeon]|nr:hypothetical protein [Desulfurococcales archaeon]
MTRILLNNIYYFTGYGVKDGFIFIENSIIKDLGSEPPIEYDLSDLIYDFGSKALALHGFSVAVTPSLYFIKKAGIKDPSTLSKEGLETGIKACLYELLLNGVVFPIIYEEKYIDVVINIAKSLAIDLGIIVTPAIENYINNLLSYKNFFLISVHEGKDYARNVIKEEEICSLDSVSPECKILYLSETLNMGSIILFVSKKLGSLEKTVSLLTKPYELFNIGKGFIEKGERADLLVYDASKLPKAPFNKKYPPDIILKGYSPDLVFIKGDIAVEKGINYIIESNALEKLLNKLIS